MPSPKTRHRVLLTGDRGFLGPWLRRSLQHAGYQVLGFDVRDGHDIRNASALARAAAAVDVIVHAATLGFNVTDEALVRDVNVDGARNVLAAAEAAGHSRVIVFSSPHVLGIAPGDDAPASFPLRNSQTRQSCLPYGRSKAEVEALCEAFTFRTGIATLCPRPFHTWVPGQAADLRARWRRNPESEWTPHWALGAFLDVRDLCSAIKLALEVPLEGHHRFLLAASDIAASVPSREIAARLAPGVPFEAGWADVDPWASLVDTTPARELLGWQPRHTWRAESRLSRAARAWGRLKRAREFGLFRPR